MSAPQAARILPPGLNASEYTVLAGPVSGSLYLTARSGSLTFHSADLVPAPAAASVRPSGLNATAYSGRPLFPGSSGEPTSTGWPGPATFHSRSVPSAAGHGQHPVIGAEADRLDHPRSVGQPGRGRGAGDSSRLARASGVPAIR